MKRTTRRDFLKLAAVTGLAVSFNGCALLKSRQAQAPVPIHCAEAGSTSLPDTFDYVVIGSGAGGGPVAANLAKAGYRVALLEAGGDDENANYSVPVFHGFASEDPAYNWDYFVKHYEDADRRKRDSKYVPEKDGVLYPRAGTLGGCTAHNAMITVYPHNSDWDRIAKDTGDASWKSGNMRTYFERLERCQYVNPNRDNASRHGFQGWLTTNMADPRLVIPDKQLLAVIFLAVTKALGEGLDQPFRLLKNPFDINEWRTVFEEREGLLKSHYDPNDWRIVVDNPQGTFGTPLATDGGKRTGTREYIQAVAKACPGKLTVITHALATRILFDKDNRAIGVEYLQGQSLYRADPRAQGTDTSDPVRKTVRAGKEVILSAGAFNSPQLLKLSGIGPKSELKKFGIDVRVDLPGVGENLQDRYEVGVITEMEHDLEVLRNCTFEPPAAGQQPDPCYSDWLKGKGVYATNGVVVGIIKKSKSERPLPDLYVFGVPSYFKGYFPTYSDASRHHKNYFTWAILKAHTNNTAGRVTLRSADPRDVPDINFHYFDESNDQAQEDLESVAEGVEFVREIMRFSGPVAKQEVIPGEQVKGDRLKEFIKNEAWGHHASCSNKMGPKSDPMAVVDSNFRVYGTKNLRVVDASVFPRIPGFFIVTSIYMISEKASDAILADAAPIPHRSLG
jgi:choline dehydrogenase